MIDNEDFLKKSIALYEGFNKHKLFYLAGKTYDKLVTADPFLISPSDYDIIKQNGPKVWNWYKEESQIYRDMESDRSLDWLKDLIEADLGPKALKYQLALSKHNTRVSRLVRADLSSMPFGCHEIQARWASLAYIHYVTNLFNEEIPLEAGEEIISTGLFESLQKVIDDNCPGDNECAILLTPVKNLQETMHSQSEFNKLHLLMPLELNEKNFDFKDGKLVFKYSGQVVKLIFRREMTLKVLTESEFGESLIKMHLDGELNFEPQLDLSNDMKIGMGLAFDKRTSHYFSEDSRSLFLRTSLFDTKLESFNSVFDKNYRDINDFIEHTTKSSRKYVYKFGGSDLHMSFGGRYVFRFDKNDVERLITSTYKKDQMWILQKLDEARFTHRFLKGNYANPAECTVETASNFAGRVKVMYFNDNGSVKPIDLTANLVNDHWKAKSKTSDQLNGKGTVTTTVRLKNL